MSYEQMHQEFDALTRALRLMGINPQKLAESMLQTGDDFWKVRTLMAVRVEFDRNSAALTEPAITAAGLDACEAWFSGMRLAKQS